MNKKETAIKGFTLIELMVVISIISLFSSIAFASFATVRVKAQEATIKSDLKNIKSQAEISFNNVGDYSTASSAVSAIIEGINKSGGTAAFYTWDNTHYSVSASLNSDPSKRWSISDTSGNTVVWDTTNQSVYINGQITNYNWITANLLCTTAGKRLPTIEELKALRDSYGTNPTGFPSGSYWSGTRSSQLPSTQSLGVSFRATPDNTNYPVFDNYQSSTLLVRCVQ